MEKQTCSKPPISNKWGYPKIVGLCHGKIPIENDDWGYPYDSGKLHTDIGDTQPKKVQWL